MYFDICIISKFLEFLISFLGEIFEYFPMRYFTWSIMKFLSNIIVYYNL